MTTNATPSLWRSWTIQRRVIGALLMREVLTRFGRHNIGFLWLFAEPMLFTLGIAALWTFMRASHLSSIPIVAFSVTGYSAVLLWRNMPMRCIKAIQPNLDLMYHRNVKVLDIFAARLLLEGAGATISFVLLSMIFISIGWMEPPEDVLLVLQGWFLLAWFGAALAIYLGTLSETYHVVDKLWSPASYIAFPLSGAAFVVDAFPPNVREVLLYIPMLNGAEMIRDGYFGSVVRSHYDVGYLVMWSLALTLLGLARTRELGRKVVPQ